MMMMAIVVVVVDSAGRKMLLMQFKGEAAIDAQMVTRWIEQQVANDRFQTQAAAREEEALFTPRHEHLVPNEDEPDQHPLSTLDVAALIALYDLDGKGCARTCPMHARVLALCVHM